MPLISVILPVYNAQSTIGRCIDSILAQTFTDFELIVVDDGSTDGSATAISSIARRDSRVRVLSQSNCGASVARNNAIGAALGQWIAFVDADDTVSTDYLASLMDVTTYDSHIDLVVEGINWMGHDGEYVQERPAADVVVEVSNAHLASWLQPPLIRLTALYGKIFRRSLIADNAITIPDDMCKYEDFAFIMRYIAHCRKIALSTAVNYSYSYDSASLSHTIQSFESNLCDMSRLRREVTTFYSRYDDATFPLMHSIFYQGVRQMLAANNFNRYNRRERLGNIAAIPQWLITSFQSFKGSPLGAVLQRLTAAPRLLDAVSQLLYRLRWSRRYHFA